MSVQWWCVAQGTPWEWTWRPYPGVWLLVAAVGVAYLGLVRPRVGSGLRAGRDELSYFAGGLFLLWAGLDWPLGALGASYLASIHMVQYLMVGILAPLLFLLAVPDDVYRSLRDHPFAHRMVSALTHPVIALVVFNVGMTVTHWPSVVDTLMASQLGSFALDLGWIVFGIVFWWPLVAPEPQRPEFHPILKIAYLAANVVILTPPAAMMFFSESPIYATYELAPPLDWSTSSPLWDQQRAAAIMKVGSAWIMAVAALVVAYRWYLEEGERSAVSD